jgi:hypothetical protein
VRFGPMPTVLVLYGPGGGRNRDGIVDPAIGGGNAGFSGDVVRPIGSGTKTGNQSGQREEDNGKLDLLS